MGKIISAIGSDINTVASSIGDLVTDVSTAIQQLTHIAEGFNTPEELKPESSKRTFVISYSDPSDIDGAIKEAIKSAKSASQKLFEKTFPSISIAGTDAGVVQDYVQGGSFDCVIKQISNDFSNWEINVSSDVVNQISQTIAEQIQAQMGAGNSSAGHHHVNMNQVIDWTVSYGLFALGDNKQGLIYAYSAALDSGF